MAGNTGVQGNVRKTSGLPPSGVKLFRLQGRHLFLTYPRVEIEREKVLEQLHINLQPKEIEKYVISTEQHEDGGGHIHAYVCLTSRCDIKNVAQLDLKIKGPDGFFVNVHGNYQSCRSYGSVVCYVVKKGLENVLTNMDLTSEGREKNVWASAIIAAESGQIEESLMLVKGRAPRQYSVDYKKLKGNFIEMKNDAQKTDVKIYAVNTFDVPEKVEEWINKEYKRKTLFLTGASGTGKTEMIKSLLSEKYGKENVLRVTDLEGLRKLHTGSYAAVIFDDINVDTRTAEEKISLIDVENASDVRILYNSVSLPAGMPRALLTNKDVASFFQFGVSFGSKEQVEAIRRRLREVDIKGKKVIIRQINELEFRDK